MLYILFPLMNQTAPEALFECIFTQIVFSIVQNIACENMTELKNIFFFFKKIKSLESQTYSIDLYKRVYNYIL